MNSYPGSNNISKVSETIEICAGANEPFMIGATAAFAGLALNAAPETQLNFHIFTEGVNPETVDFMRKVLIRLHKNSKITEHVCSDELLSGFPYWAGSRLSAARILYPEILNSLDWVLYLDCDVLYFASPEEHFSLRQESSYVCAVQEEDEVTRERECAWIQRQCRISMAEDEYFNAGVMLLNLKKCREDNMTARLLQFYQEHPDTALPDQTAMNVLFHGKKTMLPPKYDRLQIYITDEKLKENPVLHFVSGNPWLPKKGVTANGRFRLWHRFCDKYIWGKNGGSYRKCFSRKMLLQKYLLYLLLKCPAAGFLTARLLQFFRFTGNGKIWREQQVKYDCSGTMRKKILKETE